MKRQRKSACLAALAVGLMLVLTTDAMAITPAQREQAQNARITKVIRTTKTIIVNVAGLTKTVGQHTKSLATLQTLVSGIDGRVASIEAGVPVVVDSLTKLGAAAQQLKDGLTTVGAGLTTVGAGLQKLGDAYGAVEYGVVRIFNGTTPIAPALTTSDIPDDGNTASAVGSIPFVASGSTVLHTTGAIRSAEADGGATGDPAGQAGGIIYAICATPPTSGGNCGAVAAGQIGCQAGPPPSSPFTTPAGVVNLLAVNIQQKAARTDQSHPSSTDTDIISGDCTIPTAGVWIVTVNAQFLDLPTSATPGPKD
jgi:hypothetical protein